MGDWAGIAAKLAGGGAAKGPPKGMPPSAPLGFKGMAPKPDVTPTSPYYPATAPEYKEFAPEYPDLGGFWEALDLGYGYKPSDMPGTLDVFMLSDPNSILGQISEAELWSGRGTQTTPWGQEQGIPTPPEPILSMEDPYGKLQEWLGLMPQTDTIELKTSVQPGQIAPEISGILPDGTKVYYVPIKEVPEGQFMPESTGMTEVWNRMTGEMLGTVPTETIAAQLGETYGALGSSVARKYGFGGGYGPEIPSKPGERREEDLLALPGAGWEGVATKTEGITPEMASRMLVDPRWGAEERAAALPIKEAYRGWQEGVLSGELLPAEAIESFTGLFGLEGEPSIAEQTRLMQDIVQYGILSDVTIERARQLYEREYRAQLDEGATEDEARSAAGTEYDKCMAAAASMEDFVPTGFSWDALQEVMQQSPELRATLLGLFQEKGDLPHGVVRKFYSMEDYYRWQTSVAEEQPTTEADVIWSPYKKLTEYVPAGAKYMAEPGGKELIAETSGDREVYVPQDIKYQERAEQILGYTPKEGQVISPSDARAILRSAMWGGGAETQRYQEALERAEKEEKPSDYQRIYEEFVEELELYRPAELWREGR